MKVGQFPNKSLELGKIELAAKDIDQIHALLFQAPSCADAEIRKLAVFVGCIPTLNYLVEFPRQVIGAVELQPFPFDNDAGGRLRVLLVLRSEVVLSHRAAVGFYRRSREQGWLQNVFRLPLNLFPAIGRSYIVGLVAFGYRRKRQNL